MFKSLILTAATIVLCSHAAGQTATGILEGRVTDAASASVPDAKVVIENQRTGVKQVLATNTEGRFVQPFLIPSEYRVTVEKSGFQKHVTNDVRVNVQETASLNIPLKVGEVSASVEVTASVAQLSTSTSNVAMVVEMNRVLDMPLNGRNPFGLAQTVPGVIPGGGSTPWISGGRNASSGSSGTGSASGRSFVRSRST